MGYVNPLSQIKNLVLERIDQGVDFKGSGPILAIGNGTVIETTGSGWPGGPFMSYRLDDGPNQGNVVYIAENIHPTVNPGQKVSAGQPIANMFEGGTGIEMGWADASGLAPESQTAAAGSISGANLPGGGSNPTVIGKAFDDLLASLGVPHAPNYNNPTGGKNPGNFSAPAGPQGTPAGSGGGILSFPQEIIDAFKDINALVSKLVWIVNPANWLRIVAGLFGVMILGAAVVSLVGAVK